MTVAFMVFCFFFPETNVRRPPRLAGGLRTWISVASQQLDAFGLGVGEHVGQSP